MRAPFSSRPPTDYELLKAIYDRHRDEFASYVKGAATDAERSSKILVPVDIVGIAKRFDVDPDSVFGRLYFHLEQKYGEPRKEGQSGRKVFFTPIAGSDRNCINFPLMEAVLASLWQERRRDLWTYWTAAVSLAIAIASLIVALAR